MKNITGRRIHFIYEVDNIPDHRSRRFGCSVSQMAVRKPLTPDALYKRNIWKAFGSEFLSRFFIHKETAEFTTHCIRNFG